MENHNQPTIEITVESHIMTKEEIKQSKIERKQRDKNYRKERKEKKREAAKLKNNFRTMENCMIHPTNIQVGNLEGCIYRRMIVDGCFMGTGFGHVEEKYVPIDGEKVFIRIRPNFDTYVDLDEINSNKDLSEIRKKISVEGIRLGGKIMDCCIGKVRININSLHQHPYFKENNPDTPISIKQLKKIVEENRK